MNNKNTPIDKQSRKWQLTINNPSYYELTQQKIMDVLDNMKPIIYYCMSDEMASTYHTHVFIVCKSAIRFSTLKKQFPQAHLEIARGTSQENRDYVFKEGKWENSEKESTNFKETHIEKGILPIERQGTRNDLADLYDMIKSGLSNSEIIENTPDYLLQIDRMDKVRQTILQEQYKNKFRLLSVTYIYGEPRTGKTRSVMEKHTYENVYRITNYQHPFDGYSNQDIILFDEFRSQIDISEMLNYLDGYPLQLPCRYNDKTAVYTIVYIISNLPLEKQYSNVYETPTWKAFTKRIHEVHYYSGNAVKIFTTEEYFNHLLSLENPFIIRGDKNN